MHFTTEAHRCHFNCYRKWPHPEEGGSFILLIPILLKMPLPPLPGNKPNFSHEQSFQKNTDTFSNLGNSTEP